MWYLPTHCDETFSKLSHGETSDLVGRKTAPLILECLILEDSILIFNMLSISPSHVDLLPYQNNLWPTHTHWHVSTPLPLQPHLGVKEVGLEGGKDTSIYI